MDSIKSSVNENIQLYLSYFRYIVFIINKLLNCLKEAEEEVWEEGGEKKNKIKTVVLDVYFTFTYLATWFSYYLYLLVFFFYCYSSFFYIPHRYSLLPVVQAMNFRKLVGYPPTFTLRSAEEAGRIPTRLVSKKGP
jgi:hypothetical protein